MDKMVLSTFSEAVETLLSFLICDTAVGIPLQSIVNCCAAQYNDISEFFGDDQSGNVPPNLQETHTTGDGAQQKCAAVAHTIFQKKIITKRTPSAIFYLFHYRFV